MNCIRNRDRGNYAVDLLISHSCIQIHEAVLLSLRQLIKFNEFRRQLNKRIIKDESETLVMFILYEEKKYILSSIFYNSLSPTAKKRDELLLHIHLFLKHAQDQHCQDKVRSAFTLVS